MAQNNGAFRKWVPLWLRAIVAFSIMLPVMLLNGAYTGSSVDISGAMGILSEDINMAYYVASAGMAVGYPLTTKIRPVLTTKTVLLCDLVLQVLLSFICAKTSSIYVVMIMSFLIGFLKAFALLELIIMLKPIFSKKNVRSEFYAYFYPIVFGVGQVSMVLTAWLAYNYQWQYMYYFVIILLLIAIILILICFRYGQRSIHIPFKEIDGISILYISTALLLLIYVFTYGKTRDWFASKDIAVCTIAILPIFWLFVRRQFKNNNLYVNLNVLKRTKAIVGYLFMAIVMIFSSSSGLVSSYASNVLKLDNIHVNGLYLMMIPGFICGAILCFWWFRMQIWRFRLLVFWGMACFTGYFGILYFGITAGSTYEFLYLPMFLRGAGMIILFIAFGVYVVEEIDPKLMISNAFFLVGMRSLIAPVVGASLFSNLLYQGTQKNIMVLSENIDNLNSIAVDHYNQALSSAMQQGFTGFDAQQIAINSLYSTVTTQSILLTIKIIFGVLLICSITIMLISRFIPFHKTLKVKVVRSGEDMA